MSKKGTNGVVAGSVWESRRKIDEFKGGMVFKSEENLEDSNNSNDEETIIGISSSASMNTTKQQIMDRRVSFKSKQSPPSLSGKRRTWKGGSIGGNEDQIVRERSEMAKNADEQCRESSVCADGTKKSPIQLKKARSDVNKELSSSVESIDRTPFQRMKLRFVSHKGSPESSNSTEKRAVQIRKTKSDQTSKIFNGDGLENSPGTKKTKTEPSKILDHSSDGKVRNALQIVRAKSAPSSDFDETVSSSAQSRKMQLEKRDEIKRTESDENFKDFGVCEEKLITSTSVNVSGLKSVTKLKMIDDQEHSLSDDDEEEDWNMVAEEEVDEEIKVDTEKKKHHQSNENSVSVSSVVVKKLPPVQGNVSVHPTPKKPISTRPTEEFEKVSTRSHKKLDSFVDLVMWRDVSKSAFIFGVGTFVIISTSYTQDLKISVISVLSYICLAYLAATFLFRSFINREGRDIYSKNQGQVVSEEEAVWLIKLILPYANEFLLKVRALFSGDPATTMKMAVLLFVLARCGSSITIWKMAKLGFFGVFIFPKLCSAYSSQTTAYGKFWIRRFKDAWDTCSHKKAVALGVFALVWNLSSIVARIWAVFMLFVAFKRYQQALIGGEYFVVETTSIDQENKRQGQLERQRKERRSMIIQTSNQKKVF